MEAARSLPAPAAPASSRQARVERLAHWQRLGHGMFVHWSRYSPLGSVRQAQPGTTTGYPEQIQGRAKHPPGGHAKAAAGFDAPKFDADAVCGRGEDRGARCTVVPARRHHGFAMLDTTSTDRTTARRTPSARDPLKLLSNACRRQEAGFDAAPLCSDCRSGP